MQVRGCLAREGSSNALEYTEKTETAADEIFVRDDGEKKVGNKGRLPYKYLVLVQCTPVPGTCRVGENRPDACENALQFTVRSADSGQ